MVDTNGNPINALYGFCRFLVELLQKAKPEKIAIAFDESLTTSFRNDIYPAYKANREQPPEDLVSQLKLCREFADLLGLAHYASAKYEADDIIGALAHKIHEQERNLVVVTRDKDLAQVLVEGDYYWDYSADLRIPYDGIKDRVGVRPEQVADFLALTGDSVDNIPGVPGIGKKTASVILEHFDSIDDAMNNLDNVALLPVRGAKSLPDKLQSHRDTIVLAKQLTQLPPVIDMPLSLEQLQRRDPDLASIEQLFERLGMGVQTLRQIQQM